MKLKWLYLSFVLAFMAACGDEVTDDTDDTDGTPATFVDADGDKYPADVDCNDADAAINTGAAEVYYDGKDNDCDAATIDDDQDGDGVAKAEDCDDTDAGVNPDAAEIADGIDNNCDGETMIASEVDNDGDGFSAAAGDCNDQNKTINPDAAEVYYDGVNNDCDADTADKDQDGDGVKVGADCDDLDADRSPDNAEVYYDGMDNDCDMTTIDDDKDGDGFAATSEGGDDCADGNADRNPGMADIPADGVDNDCSGADLAVNTTNGIFVDGTNGDDMNAGTKALPKKTIQAAADAIYGDAKTVFVAKGVYVEAITTSVSIVGGFRNQAGTWTYAPGSNPVAITSDTNGTEAIEVLDTFTVSLVSLDVSGFNNSGSGQTGVYVDNEANLLVYASTITSGLSGNCAYGIAGGYWKSQIISIVNSTIEAVNPNNDCPYAIEVEYADMLVVRDSHIQTTSDYCYPIELYSTDSHIVDNTLKCDDVDHVVGSSGGNVIYTEMGKHLIADNTFANQGITSNTDLIEIDSGDAVVRGNTFHLGESNGDVDLVYPYYSNVIVENNQFTVDVMDDGYLEMYAYVANARYANNTVTVLSNVNTSTEMYPLYAEYGNYESYNNTWTLHAQPEYFDWIAFMYIEYGTLRSESDKVTVTGEGFDSGYGVESYYSTLTVEDYTIKATGTKDYFEGAYLDEVRATLRNVDIDLGYVGNYVYGIDTEYSSTLVSDFDFYAGTVSGSDNYLIYVYYGDLRIADSEFEVEHSEGWIALVENDDGGLTMNNVDVAVRATEDGAEGLYNYYGGTVWDGGSVVIGDADGSCSEYYAIDNYGGGAELYNVSMSLGDNRDCEIYGIYSDDAGTTVANVVITTGAAATQYGIYPSEAGPLLADNFKLLVGPATGDSYAVYGYDSPMVIVDSVIAVTGATTGGDSYGFYDCCGYAGYQIINTYIAAGEGVDGDAYGIYAEGYADFIVVNSVISAGATAPTNVGGEATVLYSAGSDNTFTLLNNIFTSPGGLDLLGYSDDAGDLDTMGDVNGCEWVECQQASGNFKVNDVDNLFVNRAANNYKQKASSAGVDAGVDGTPHTYYPEYLLTDMNGTARPAGGAWDIGPDELP